VEFDYFYNRDGDRFSYYMLPKIIVTDERFKNLCLEILARQKSRISSM